MGGRKRKRRERLSSYPTQPTKRSCSFSFFGPTKCPHQAVRLSATPWRCNTCSANILITKMDSLLSFRVLKCCLSAATVLSMLPQVRTSVALFGMSARKTRRGPDVTPSFPSHGCLPHVRSWSHGRHEAGHGRCCPLAFRNVMQRPPRPCSSINSLIH